MTGKIDEERKRQLLELLNSHKLGVHMCLFENEPAFLISGGTFEGAELLKKAIPKGLVSDYNKQSSGAELVYHYDKLGPTEREVFAIATARYYADFDALGKLRALQEKAGDNFILYSAQSNEQLLGDYFWAETGEFGDYKSDGHYTDENGVTVGPAKDLLNFGGNSWLTGPDGEGLQITVPNDENLLQITRDVLQKLVEISKID